MNLYSRRDLDRPDERVDVRNLTVTVTARGYRRRLRVGTPRTNEDVVAGGGERQGRSGNTMNPIHRVSR